MPYPPEVIQQETEKRVAKAREALSGGVWRIAEDDLGFGYRVDTGRNIYLVELSPEPRCTCQDFKQHGASFPCKHIHGVRLWSQQPPAGEQETPRTTTKGEKQMDTFPTPNGGWVRLYHPTTGALATLPIAAETPEQALQAVEAYLAAGWKAEYAQVEKETRVPVTHIVRRVKANADGTETPVLDVYTGGRFRTLGVYLNTPDDVAAFEQACGQRLSDFPLYEGGAPIERGANPRLDKKYVIPVQGLSVVFKPNPRWEGEEDKKHPKRLFVRWAAAPTLNANGRSKNDNGHNGPPTPPAPAPAPGPTQADPVAWARGVICPMGTKSRPDLKGQPLGVILEQPDIGPKVIEYLATKFVPGTDAEREAVQAAKVLFAQLQPVAA